MMDNKIFTMPFIRGVAAVVPKARVVLEDLAAELNLTDTALKNITRLSGIREIRKSAADETISDYCIAAAENLINELNFDRNAIDGVIFVTSTPDYLTPGPGFIVHESLNLSKNCVTIDLNLSCAGYVSALFQAYLMIQSGYCRNILLCAGDTHTKRLNQRDKSMRMIMSDAGTATIISAGENCQSTFSFYSEGGGLKFLYVPAGGTRIPIEAGITDVEETDAQGNVRTLENFYMDGLEITAFAVGAAPRNIENTLNRIGWTKDDVDRFYLHQANNFIVDSIRKRIKVPAEKVPFVLGNFGNVTCATIPLAMCVDNFGTSRKLDRVIMSAFGGGLACTTAALSLARTYFGTVSEYSGVKFD